MKLSSFTDYSIRTLMYAAINSDELCKTKEISKYFDVSYNHLTRVVHKLSSLGYIDVHKGRTGGFTLAVEPDQISLAEIVKEFESDFDIVECFNREVNECRLSPFCKVKGHLNRAKDSFIKELEGVTIKDVIKGTKKSWRL